ncbi:MAG: fluoride efflux transporter CrcB [Methylacidiphilales bacterium]|nr:fluoride efflux transporter CrcB [Candidatus Methylacidiphilales bacterium]
MITSYALVVLGGGIGAGLRFALSSYIAVRYGESFPLGTLVINVTGSFVIGLLASLSDVEGRMLLSPYAREFLMIGVLGGYTTFSSFSLQTLNLARDGEWLYAGLNAMLSLALCLAAVWLGHVLAQLINNWR